MNNPWKNLLPAMVALLAPYGRDNVDLVARTRTGRMSNIPCPPDQYLRHRRIHRAERRRQGQAR